MSGLAAAFLPLNCVPDHIATVPGAWVVYCDGSAAPNPGRMGMGAVLTEPGGIHHRLCQTTQAKGCNNEAELRALMAALGELQSRGATRLVIYCDNSIVVEQLVGVAVKPIARLAQLFEEARALLGTFECATLKWIPRHRNSEADTLARAALGMPAKRSSKIPDRSR
jgi:ribonuclease HI